MDKYGPVKRLQVDVLGERNFPMHRATVPEMLVEDWAPLLAKIRETTPDATHDTLLRAIVIYGTRAVTQLLAKRQVIAADGNVRPPAALKGREAATALAAGR